MKLIFLPLLSVLATSAFATPEPVNCRDEISYKPIYSGPVQCDANYSQTTCKPTGPSSAERTTTPRTQTLYGNAEPTTKNTMYLSKLITVMESSVAGPGACTIPKNVSLNIECEASINFSHNEEVKTRICDYKPVSEFYIAQHKVNSLLVNSSSRDFDGKIIDYNWIVDGVSVSRSSSADLPYKNGLTSTFHIHLTVTDDDGYTSSSARSLTVKNDECTTQECRNR